MSLYYHSHTTSLYSSCAVCKKNNWFALYNSHDRVFGNKKEFLIKRCRYCGVIALFPQPNRREMSCYYEKQYYAYSQTIEKNIIFSIRRYLIQQSVKNSLWGRILTRIFPLPSIPQYKSKSKLLDIGCGGGQTLKILDDIGWDTYGIEIDKNAVDLAKRKGLKNITLGSFEVLEKFPDRYFNAIRLYHVIEHLDNPQLCLQLAYKKLKKGGELLIGTPNYDSLIGRLGGTYWFNLDTPRHLYIFNPRLLKEMLEKNKFRIKKLQFSSGGGIVYTIQYFLSDRFGWKISFDRHWLLLLFYPMDWLVDCLHQGDVFTVEAIK